MSEHDQAAPPEPRLERGCRIGLDVGTVRIGVARSDPDGILATPHDTVQRQEGADIRRLAAIVTELEAAVVYVGLPRTLRGGDSASTALAREMATRLAGAVAPVEVRLVDERLSTVDAGRMMRESGRSARQQRAAIDSAAAVVILQTALDAERGSVTRAGEPVGEARWERQPTPDAPQSGTVADAPGGTPTPRPRKPRHKRSATRDPGPTEGTQ